MPADYIRLYSAGYMLGHLIEAILDGLFGVSLGGKEEREPGPVQKWVGRMFLAAVVVAIVALIVAAILNAAFA